MFILILFVSREEFYRFCVQLANVTVFLQQARHRADVHTADMGGHTRKHNLLLDDKVLWKVCSFYNVSNPSTMTAESPMLYGRSSRRSVSSSVMKAISFELFRQ